MGSLVSLGVESVAAAVSVAISEKNAAKEKCEQRLQLGTDVEDRTDYYVAIEGPMAGLVGLKVRDVKSGGKLRKAFAKGAKLELKVCETPVDASQILPTGLVAMPPVTFWSKVRSKTQTDGSIRAALCEFLQGVKDPGTLETLRRTATGASADSLAFAADYAVVKMRDGPPLTKGKASEPQFVALQKSRRTGCFHHIDFEETEVLCVANATAKEDEARRVSRWRSWAFETSSSSCTPTLEHIGNAWKMIVHKASEAAAMGVSPAPPVEVVVASYPEFVAMVASGALQ